MLEKLRIIVEERNTRAGLMFDVIVQIVILISLISFSYETTPDLDIKTIKILHIIEQICVAVFSLEYILRVIVAKNKLKYIFSFYGIIDFLSIVPFYLNTTLDLRSLKTFRFVRLFRLFKISRYNPVFDRFNLALKYAKDELYVFLTSTVIILYLSAVGIYLFEHEAQPEVFSSVFESLWWAVATLTTVGYGDAYPITVGGKIFTFVILMIGLGIIAVPAGVISSSLSKARDEIEKEELERKKHGRYKKTQDE